MIEPTLPQSSVELKKNPDRLQSLDFLRGIAIMGVMLFHFFGDFEGWGNLFKYSGEIKDLSGQSFTFYLFYPLSYGYIGVSLFFVISGFCIHYKYANQLKKEGRYTFKIKEFLLNRFLRIYPPYLLALLGFTLLHIFLTKLNYFWGWRNLITHALLIHNFWKDTFYTINVSFWSIAIEAQFYMLYPLFLIVASRIGTTMTTFLLIGFSLLVIPIRLFELDFQSGDFIYSFYSSTLFLWSAWATGALLAEKYVFQDEFIKSRYLKYFLIVFSVIHIATDSIKSLSFISFWTGSLAALFLAGTLIQNEIKTNMLRNLSSEIVISKESWLGRFIKFTGVISYSLYLLHQPLMGYIYHVVELLGLSPAPGFRWLLLPFYLLFIYVVSWFFFKIIEEKSHRFARQISAKISGSKLNR